MQLSANGVAIEVEDDGPPDGAPLLLVMGLGMQLTSWPDEFVRLLVERGLRVIRFDNRDAGLSQGFDAFGVPNVPVAAVRRMMHLPVRAPYTLRDMAADALGVLDALGLARAHVCGASLGGMVAQHLAAEHAGRVASLTLMMTTSGSRRLPQPTPKAQLALVSRPAGRTRDALVEHMVRVLTVIGSPGALRADPSELRARVAAALARSYRPAGTARQLLAVAADGDRTPLLARIEAPTHVIHGSADPLVPVENGRDLAARIRGATHDFIEGMGHDLPQALLARFADGIAANARRAGTRGQV
jgi:pimeloyl-ACP methyl ester carboxylesterase